MPKNKSDKHFKKTMEKVGRNIYNLQLLETGLKLMMSRCLIHGDDLPSLIENRDNNIKKQNKKTLGNLVNEYIDRIYQGEAITNDSKVLMQFSVEADEKFISERKNVLEELVVQRNHLVHQRLIELDNTSVSSCKKLCSELDEQNEIIKSEFEILRDQGLSLIEAANYIETNIRANGLKDVDLG